MSVQPGMKRLKEFDYLTELSEKARQVLDIPEDAEVLNITDEFARGGPIVISYCLRGDIETAKSNKRNLDFAIDKALRALSASAPA